MHTQLAITLTVTVSSCSLGGLIAAYKIVPDEIDEIKVSKSLTLRLK